MLQRTLSVIGLLTVACAALSQQNFKFDNTVYKAVYLNEAFRMMDSAKNYLLLDVRSPGEYADTSQHTALNIGRIKGAMNISIDSVSQHLQELKKYSDQPVFVYCSHSQRSRRVSKLLGENGFKKVYNINGGMSLVNEMDDRRFPYKDKVWDVNTAYRNIASVDAVKLIETEPELAIIDIRTTPEFNSKDSLPENNVGRFKKAINLPQKEFAEKFDSYHIRSDRPVLLYDLDGINSMDVVDILRAKGFSRIYNLFEGFAAFACDHQLTNALRTSLLTGAHPYALVDAESVIALLKGHPDVIVIDTRPKEEFENKSTMSFHNIGRITGAINISSREALNAFMQTVKKTTPMLVYCGMSDDFGTKACDELAKSGFSNVNYLNQGLYRFVWAAANIEDCSEGKKFLVDHEGFY